MPTPSDRSATVPRERRSLFGNYRSEPPAPQALPAPTDAPRLRRGAPEDALARCFLHGALARAFDYPDPERWAWLRADSTLAALRAAVVRLCPDPRGSLSREFEALAAALAPDPFTAFHDDYVAAIGHAARGSSPINEIEYGDLRADPLFQPHRLADLAAFYRAFGMELGPEGGERHDHLAVELEFMAVLTGQEAHALAQRLPDDLLAVNLQAQRRFLREHLGRWCPAFARRLQGVVGERVLGQFARFLLAFVVEECRRLEVPSGAEDLHLRPADEAASLCDACGLAQSLPGNAAVAEPA